MDGSKVRKLLEARGIKANAFAAHLGISGGMVSKWLNGKAQIAKEHHGAIAEFLGISADELATGEGQALFDQVQMYEFINKLDSTNCVFVISADGYKERSDPSLFAQMVKILKKGVKIRYYYPKNALKSLEDFQYLHAEYAKISPELTNFISVYRINPQGRHMVGWRSRFVLFVVRTASDSHRKVRHAFEFFEAGFATVGGASEVSKKGVWIRLEDEKAQEYLSELRAHSDPVQEIDIFINRLKGDLQNEYRRKLSSQTARECYRRLREQVSSPETLLNTLDDVFPDWWHQETKIFQREGEGITLRLLDIGTGDGSVFDGAVRRIQKLVGIDDDNLSNKGNPRTAPNISIRATFIEPSNILTDDWSHTLSTRATIPIRSPFEDWDPKDKEFDFIFAVHSFYLIDPSYIKKVYDILSDRGVALFIHAPFSGNVLNSITSVLDNALQTKQLGASIGTIKDKAVTECPSRIFAEDIAHFARKYFGEQAVTVRTFSCPLALSIFIRDDDQLTDAAKDAISFFGEPYHSPSAARTLEIFPQIVEACKKLRTNVNSPTLLNSEHCIILRKSNVFR